MKSHIAQTTKGPIEYTYVGNGPVVLVCHGTSSDCHSTHLSASLVDAGFSVLTPSRPGYGQTPLMVGRTADQAAQALIALLDHLNIETCSVIAISGGGPTGVALAANFPQRVNSLVLAAAVTHPQDRSTEPAYKNQMTFYGPLHSLIWSMLGLMGRLSPRMMARQTLAIFSTHDPEAGLQKLSASDIKHVSRFYQGHSSRQGVLNDATHTVGEDVLIMVQQPALVIHSREDKSVLFNHAEWSLKHVRRSELFEAGITGHFFWIGPDSQSINQQIVAFLQQGVVES